jgi:phasin family protein
MPINIPIIGDDSNSCRTISDALSILFVGHSELRNSLQIVNIGTILMNEQFTRQAQEMFDLAKDASLPENFQVIAQDGVAKSREAFEKINSVAQDGAKTAEEMLLASQVATKAMGDKVMTNAAANTEAFFDAAQTMAKATTLPELFRLQTEFFQKQAAVVSAQSTALFETSAKAAAQTVDTMNAAASKSNEPKKPTAARSIMPKKSTC